MIVYFVWGEDIRHVGGIWGHTAGLYDEFGAERIIDTPISETGFIGAGVGAAIEGMRPIVDLMFVDFFGVCNGANLQRRRENPLHVRVAGIRTDGD